MNKMAIHRRNDFECEENASTTNQEQLSEPSRRQRSIAKNFKLIMQQKHKRMLAKLKSTDYEDSKKFDKIYDDEQDKKTRDELSEPTSCRKNEYYKSLKVATFTKASSDIETADNLENSKIMHKENSKRNSSEEKPLETKRRSLKSVIKEVKNRSIEALEDNYNSADIKRTPIVFKLARHYLRTNIEKVKEMLVASTLPESKFLLVQI
mmetsp:Transcript_23995/g.21317  ORF Transcript_23995/g.21317 Transcript_23995/m.21317 type:complete len:208 (+) Transcript_23995:11-634(+)